MDVTYLLLLAVAPAIALMIYVWKKDKSKEPFKMLVILIVLGAVSCLPAALVELGLGAIIQPVFGGNKMTYSFVNAFFGVALVEEGFKFLFMFLYTRNHKEFNGLFDGMIYAVFISLGFAALENIMYVFEGGAANAFSRAVTAVPGHMFFGVFMGYNYSLWHTYKLCDKSEKYFANLGMLTVRPPEFKYSGYLVKAIILPILIHGFYDFCLFTENETFVGIYFIFLIALYIICFARIKKLSKADKEDYELIPMMLCQKYPELIGVITPRQPNPMAMPNSYYQNRYNTYNNANQYAAQGQSVYPPQNNYPPGNYNNNSYR